eukprot:1809274-Pyramimonas_sp.AAC.1
MHTRKTFHALNVVEGLPCVKITSDGCTYQNNQWVLGWTKYHHGRCWPSARAPAKLTWTNVFPVFVTPMVFIRKLIEGMANLRLLPTHFERKRCTGHHQHSSVCNKELARAAQYTPKMQSLFVEASQLAHDMLLVNRDPFHDHPHSPSVR